MLFRFGARAYTSPVGTALRRFAGLLVMVVLVAGPAVASLCAASCMDAGMVQAASASQAASDAPIECPEHAHRDASAGAPSSSTGATFTPSHVPFDCCGQAVGAAAEAASRIDVLAVASITQTFVVTEPVARPATALFTLVLRPPLPERPSAVLRI